MNMNNGTKNHKTKRNSTQIWNSHMFGPLNFTSHKQVVNFALISIAIQFNGNAILSLKI